MGPRSAVGMPMAGSSMNSASSARGQAVHRWLEVASACECQTLDVCGLVDDSALGLREQQRWPVGRAALQVIPPV